MKFFLIGKNHSFWHYILVVVWYFLSGSLNALIWIVVMLAGAWIFQAKKSPYDIIFGLPLMLMGLGFIIQNFSSSALTIFDPKYNRGVCFLCQKE